MTRPRLRGLCWDHARCVQPMRAAADRYARENGVDVAWDARPLAAFNDQPLDEVAEGYDLVFIDHPTIGSAAGGGWLHALDDVLDRQVLAELAADSVGRSQDTYVWQGRTWAIAVDAACQVAAHRPDLLEALGSPLPRTWSEVADLAERHPRAVALPLYPSDALCSLLSLSAQFDPACEPGSPNWPHPDAVALLSRLARAVDPGCLQLNPPQLLDRMARGDTIAYAPLLFGYTNYARPDAPGHRLRFSDPPSPTGLPAAALLGGAGIAVPATSAHPAEAARFAAWCAHPATQRDVVLPHGGQPASRTVWTDPEADGIAGGFFHATRRSMEAAHVRPRAAWWPGYALAASLELNRLLAANVTPSVITSALHRLLKTTGPAQGATTADATDPGATQPGTTAPALPALEP